MLGLVNGFFVLTYMLISIGLNVWVKYTLRVLNLGLKGSAALTKVMYA